MTVKSASIMTVVHTVSMVVASLYRDMRLFWKLTEYVMSGHQMANRTFVLAAL